MFEVTFEVLLLLIAAGFVAGFIDAVAGGGGLITVPVLLIAGANPVTALATNKIQGLFGSATAAISYARGGHVDLRTQWKSAVIAFFASIGGALLVSLLPVELIRYALPILLVGIAIFFATKKGLDDVDRARRLSPAIFAATVVPLCAAYDGLLGPGAGSFYMLAFVGLAGYGILKATAHTKLLNFASNSRRACGFCRCGDTLVAHRACHGHCTDCGRARRRWACSKTGREGHQTAVGADHHHPGAEIDLGFDLIRTAILRRGASRRSGYRSSW